MNSVVGLIVRLERAEGMDRRLDAEVVATVLGPPDCVLNPFESLDGWDIELAPDENGEAALWMEGADVPLVTSSLDDAAKVLGQARPDDGAMIMVRTLTSCPSPQAQCPTTYASRLARSICAELLRTIALAQLQSVLHRTTEARVQEASLAI